MVIEKYLAKLEFNSIDIEESIVDGSDDCGIDAIVIDEETEDYPRVYFFQSKYYEAENAFERTFEGNAIDKLTHALNDFVLGGTINEEYQNERLVDKLRSVKNLGDKNPRYTLVFCSNSNEPAATAKTRLNDFAQKTNKTAGGNYISVEYVHLDRIASELIAPPQKTSIDLKLQISGRYLTEDTGDVRLFLGAVEGETIADLVEKHGDDIFERNVRGFLKKGNAVNRQIIATATGENSPYFIYMNNGLTITCNKFSHTPLQNSPSVEIEDAQIVNGQQTARSLHEARKKKELKSDVKVIVRIVETRKKDILADIIEATNSQNKVTSRDLRSNDQIQKLIEKTLLTKGYYYEARKAKYQGKETSRRIDAETCAQAYYASKFEEPALAKDKKKLLFGDKYDEIFDDKTNPMELLGCFLLLRGVQARNKKEKYTSKYTFLNDAALHTVALIYNKIKNAYSRVSEMDEKEFDRAYEAVLAATADLVQEKLKEEGDKYEHRRTFKDLETYGRIVEILKRKRG